MTVSTRLSSLGSRLVLAVSVAASACTLPTVDSMDDLEATSCASWLVGVAPNDPTILPVQLTVREGGGGTLGTCFYRDRVRPQDAQAITWESMDPSIATVNPTRGPETYVTGQHFGVTHVKAVITGIDTFALIVVCDSTWTCP